MSSRNEHILLFLLLQGSFRTPLIVGLHQYDTVQDRLAEFINTAIAIYT